MEAAPSSLEQRARKSSIYDTTIAGLYDLEETIGRGHYAVVKLARHVFTGEKVAVKVIDKTKLDKLSQDHLFQEVKCMKLVQHPNIVRLYEVIDTQTKLFLILELGDYDLYDYLTKNKGGKLNEQEARIYFGQIVQAISYCHELHVVHRDLKPENVVFFNKLGMVKLTDFGFSNIFCPGEKLETSCGSLAYSAPEILLGDSYDPTSVDVWSLGVILYMLVSGNLPFNETNDSETLTRILDCSFELPSYLSSHCKSLIKRLLVRNAPDRATLAEIQHHAWLQEVHPASGDGPKAPRFWLPLVSRSSVSDQQHQQILDHMVNGGIAQEEEVLKALERNDYTYVTAAYFLLAERLLRKERQEQAAERLAEYNERTTAAALSPRSDSRGGRSRENSTGDDGEAQNGGAGASPVPSENGDNGHSQQRRASLTRGLRMQPFSILHEESEEELAHYFEHRQLSGEDHGSRGASPPGSRRCPPQTSDKASPNSSGSCHCGLHFATACAIHPTCAAQALGQVASSKAGVMMRQSFSAPIPSLHESLRQRMSDPLRAISPLSCSPITGRTSSASSLADLFGSGTGRCTPRFARSRSPSPAMLGNLSPSSSVSGSSSRNYGRANPPSVPRRTLPTVTSSPQLLAEICEEEILSDENLDVAVTSQASSHLRVSASSPVAATYSSVRAVRHRQAVVSPDVIRRYEQRRIMRTRRSTSCSSSETSDDEDKRLSVLTARCGLAANQRRFDDDDDDNADGVRQGGAYGGGLPKLGGASATTHVPASDATSVGQYGTVASMVDASSLRLRLQRLVCCGPHSDIPAWLCLYGEYRVIHKPKSDERLSSCVSRCGGGEALQRYNYNKCAKKLRRSRSCPNLMSTIFAANALPVRSHQFGGATCKTEYLLECQSCSNVPLSCVS